LPNPPPPGDAFITMSPAVSGCFSYLLRNGGTNSALPARYFTSFGAAALPPATPNGR
jgi:hypothetical protein